MIRSSVLDDGPLLASLDLRTWARAIDSAERSLLAALAGPVLDVGCGPGRLVAALTERGVAALGIDIAPIATELAMNDDAPILGYSVFERLPGEGRWPTVLLFDGNIGIGGDPMRLLTRIRDLLATGGTAIVEVAAPWVDSQRGRAEIELTRGCRTLIDWAVLSSADVAALSTRAELHLESVREVEGRWFAWLRS